MTHPLVERLEFDFPTVLDALDAHVAARPDAVAVLYGETGETWTYADLGARTDRLAGNLAQLGIKPEDRVSVFTTNALVACEAMFGIWKAGGVYAPVNFQYRGGLLAYQLNDTRPETLIVDTGLLPALQDVSGRLIEPPRLLVVVQSGSGEGDAAGQSVPYERLRQPAERPAVQVRYNSPANVVYTSGTTGPSKGVLQTHRWINAYTWPGRQLLTADDVVYNDLPMYHVGGAHYNVCRPIWVGASVCLWNRFSPNDFWNRITSYGCTAAVLLDVMIPWLMKAEPSEHDRRNPLKQVHMQPLPATHNEFAKRFGIDVVTSGFGQSESGAGAITLIQEAAPGEGTPADLFRGLEVEEMKRRFEQQGLLVVESEQTDLPKGIMGLAGPFIEVAVFDGDDLPVPDGEVGELVMRPRLPDLLFTEYLGKPEATVRAWRNLWFHAGDAIIRRPDGILTYVDRLGDRLRVRGENLSSFHVEELLASHPSVQVASVVAVPSAEGDEDSIVAFVELKAGHDFDSEALMAHCRDTMPRFMVPSRILPVDEMPRTPTNKVEKYKLRQSLDDGN